LEETGLSVRVKRVLDVISGREHERGADIVIAYQGEVLSGTPSPGDDADAVEWFARNNLPSLAFTATQKILAIPTK
jgi:ADP-ribose pyrophosphatase YjhB (NUDIX family)